MEECVTFSSDGLPLFGVLHSPEHRLANGTAVVFLHGWGGYRIGPHRMFVTAARRLTARGYHCLRFDFRGRGDSGGETRQATIETMTEDTRRAVEFAAAKSNCSHIVLLGICSGSKVAMAACSCSPLIASLALWSAEVLGPGSAMELKARKSARSLSAYAAKLLRPSTWLKIATGRVNTHLVRKAVWDHKRSTRDETESDRSILATFKAFRGRALFVYGESDPQAGPAMAQFTAACKDAGIDNVFHVVKDADHSFYSLDAEKEALELTDSWLGAGAG